MLKAISAGHPSVVTLVDYFETQNNRQPAFLLPYAPTAISNCALTLSAGRSVPGDGPVPRRGAV